MATKITHKERGRIVHKGMGGFLNPPGHPEHEWSMQIDLKRRPENRGGMSLSAAAECDWLADLDRAAARSKLESWEKSKLPLQDPLVQDWVHQVLGYFHNCYRGDGPEPECWCTAKLKISDAEHAYPVENHAGVHLIRNYYPQYEPKGADFDAAYWGKKQS